MTVGPGGADDEREQALAYRPESYRSLIAALRAERLSADLAEILGRRMTPRYR